MSLFLVEETMLFIKACVLGLFLGVIYDLFRIYRIFVKSKPLNVFIQDILYFTIITIITFMFLLVYNDGRLRMFILIGELMGSVIYFFSISIIVLKFSNIIAKVLFKTFHIIFYPFSKIKIKLSQKFDKMWLKFSSKMKKIKLFDKFSLKNIVHIVYNRLICRK